MSTPTSASWGESETTKALWEHTLLSTSSEREEVLCLYGADPRNYRELINRDSYQHLANALDAAEKGYDHALAQTLLTSATGWDFVDLYAVVVAPEKYLLAATARELTAHATALRTTGARIPPMSFMQSLAKDLYQTCKGFAHYSSTWQTAQLKTAMTWASNLEPRDAERLLFPSSVLTRTTPAPQLLPTRHLRYPNEDNALNRIERVLEFALSSLHPVTYFELLDACLPHYTITDEYLDEICARVAPATPLFARLHYDSYTTLLKVFASLLKDSAEPTPELDRVFLAFASAMASTIAPFGDPESTTDTPNTTMRDISKTTLAWNALTKSLPEPPWEKEFTDILFALIPTYTGDWEDIVPLCTALTESESVE